MEVSIPSGKVVQTIKEMASVTPANRDALAGSVLTPVAKHGIVVLPPGFERDEKGDYGPDPKRGALELREQLREDIASQFGLTGLLTRTDAGAIQELWRVAVVRTFEPMARLIEAEASAKLGTEIRLATDRWVAAPHSEVARAINQRASAVGRLVTAGIEPERAITLAGM